MKAKIYTKNDCPKCKILKAIANRRNFDFEEETNLQPVIDQGYTSVPVMELDGNYYDFNRAFLLITKDEESN